MQPNPLFDKSETYHAIPLGTHEDPNTTEIEMDIDEEETEDEKCQGYCDRLTSILIGYILGFATAILMCTLFEKL